MEDYSDYHLISSFDSSLYLGVAVLPVSPGIVCRGCRGGGGAGRGPTCLSLQLHRCCDIWSVAAVGHAFVHNFPK